jgi:hypothetical protein
MSRSASDHRRFRVPGRTASLLIAAVITWPFALHTRCEGGTTGVDNPGMTGLPVEFRDEAGTVVRVRSALEIYAQDHNPAMDTAPLLPRQLEGGQGLRLTATGFDRILAGRTPKRSAALELSATVGPAVSDTLIRFNLVFPVPGHPRRQ